MGALQRLSTGEIPANLFIFLILASTGIVLGITVACLLHGISTVFMHFYYLPIILIAYYYRRRGILPIFILSLTYFILATAFTYPSVLEIGGAALRAGMFILIGVVVAELAERLEQEKERYRQLVEATNDIAYSCDPQGNLTYISPQVRRYGHGPGDMVGRPFMEFVLPEDRDGFRQDISSLLSTGEPPIFRFRFRTATDQPVWFEAGGARECDSTGACTGIRGVIRDISERRRVEEELQRLNTTLEERVRDRTAELEGEVQRSRLAEEKVSVSLREKEVLLREVHHRVKNNMQVISSLLSLQSQNIGDEKVRMIFKESRNRIRSIALVHELLYRSKSLEQIEYGAYLRKMAGPLFESYNVDPRKVAIRIDAVDVMMDIEKAVPCSLIVNELISNSLKHAVPGDRIGEIFIGMRLDIAAGAYVLDYRDNGVGFPPGMDLSATGTLGLRLITGLVRQLEGTLETPPGDGARFRITFPTASLHDRT